MLHIEEIIVVEGKYDKERLKKITDAPIVCTGGFSIYKNKQLINFLKQAAENNGIIILTDSDSAGFRIRNRIKQCIGNNGKITNAYIPSISGKEKRKLVPGKEGLLGVEGIDEKVLEEILLKAATACKEEKKIYLDKARFFTEGFSGKADSEERRKELAKLLNLPLRISANSMIDIINKTVSEKDFESAVLKIQSRKDNQV